MIFQEPMTSLNPLTILKNKSLNVFQKDKSDKSKCINLLKEVGIENPK